MKADKRIRNQIQRTERARRSMENTCPASRHLHMIALALAQGKPYPMLSEEPEYCAETMLSVLESLWKLRTRTGWPTQADHRRWERTMKKAGPVSEPG